MKNKKGFTLVELMAVIIIISLIAILTFPNIINQIKKSKQATTNNINDIVISAAKRYVADNPDKYNKDAFLIPISELIDNDYVKEDIVSTKDNDVSKKYVVYIDNKYSFSEMGYVQVEYLQSTRTQVLDLNYYPKKNTKVELEVKFSGTFSTINTSIFGTTNGETSQFSLNFGENINSYNSLFSWPDKPCGKGGLVNLLNITNEIRMNKNIMVMGKNLFKYGSLSRSINTKTSDCDTSFALFGIKKADGLLYPFGGFDMTVYSLKIYEDEDLVRYFIPVLDKNGVASLYDKVEGKFYYNQGTGEFLWG